MALSSGGAARADDPVDDPPGNAQSRLYDAVQHLRRVVTEQHARDLDFVFGDWDDSTHEYAPVEAGQQRRADLTAAIEAVLGDAGWRAAEASRRRRAVDRPIGGKRVRCLTAAARGSILLAL